MSLEPDQRPGAPDDNARIPGSGVSYRGQILRGVALALACGTLFTVPWNLLAPVLRPQNVVNAVGILLLGENMLAGYVGGRAATRAGLSHEDGRAQWSMAWTVAVLSYVIENVVQQVQFAAHPARVEAVASHSVPFGLLVHLVFFTAVVLLVRFGFAMGTYAQAKREGRVHDDEDEASAD